MRVTREQANELAAEIGIDITGYADDSTELASALEHIKETGGPKLDIVASDAIAGAPVPLAETPLRGERVEGPTPKQPPPGRKLTPQQLDGMHDLLRGRMGKVTRAAGPGSYVCELEDGNEVVLPGNALYLIGEDVPKAPELPSDSERVKGWKDMIGGRTGGRVTGNPGPQSFEVTYPDGFKCVMPADALPHIGVGIPLAP